MTTLAETRPSIDKVEHLDIPVEHSPTLEHPIRVRSRPMPFGVRIALHTHPWAQVAYTSRGVLRVATARRLHLDGAALPRDLGAAERDARGRDRRRRVHAHALRRCERDPAGLGACRVVEVAAAARGHRRVGRRHDHAVAGADARHARARRNHQIATLALSVPMPTEKRLRALCDAVLADLSNSDLERWSSEAGASTRIISRLFQRTGREFFAMASAGHARARSLCSVRASRSRRWRKN